MSLSTSGTLSTTTGSFTVPEPEPTRRRDTLGHEVVADGDAAAVGEP